MNIRGDNERKRKKIIIINVKKKRWTLIDINFPHKPTNTHVVQHLRRLPGFAYYVIQSNFTAPPKKC